MGKIGHKATQYSFVLCAWRHDLVYTLAEVEMELDGLEVKVQAAVSENIPVLELMYQYWGSLAIEFTDSMYTKDVEKVMMG